MLARWISAAFLMPFYIAVCLWGPFPYTIGIFIVAAIGLAEMVLAYRQQGYYPSLPFALCGLMGPAVGFLKDWRAVYNGSELFFGYSAARLFLALLGIVVIWAVVTEVVRAARTGEFNSARNIGYGMLCGLYISLFGGLTWLRNTGATVHAGPLPTLSLGAALVLQVTFCVWATDSFALFAGKAFGKHKLAPHLSPAKTVEGAIGGLAAALIFGSLFGWLFLGSALIGALIGAIAGIFGQIGDLFESSLKREAGIKDFGCIFPGHGGVLDRFDSLLIVSALVALVLMLLGRPEYGGR